MFKNELQDLPIYKKALEDHFFPILDKKTLAKHIPDGFLNQKTKDALAEGRAEFVETTGTSHERMQLIRPPFFLLNQYFRIWKEHPALKKSWEQGCMRVSLTTYRATQHVTKLKNPTIPDRIFGGRVLYINLLPDPFQWDKAELERMVSEIRMCGPYHLDGDPIYIAYLIKKLKQYSMWDSFPLPETVVHGYELCPGNVRNYIASNIPKPIVDLYGSTEIGYLFSRNPDGTVDHYLYDDIELELLPLNGLIPFFSLIITSRRNPYMPLIRYQSGDCVETSDGSPDYRKISRICGRETELLKIKEEKAIAHALFDDFIRDAAEPIFLYQFQVHKDHCQFLYTTFNDRELPPEAAHKLKMRLEELTALSCRLLHRESISPGNSGKYPWIHNI